MSRIQLQDLPQDETLDGAAMTQVRGGIIAILIGLNQPSPLHPGGANFAFGDGSVRSVPTDQFSLNFGKI